MEDYQIFIIVFSSMTIMFLCCALPTLSKTCIHSSSVSPSSAETYIKKNNKYTMQYIIKHIKRIKNLKKIKDAKYLPQEKATIEHI